MSLIFIDWINGIWQFVVLLSFGLSAGFFITLSFNFFVNHYVFGFLTTSLYLSEIIHSIIYYYNLERAPTLPRVSRSAVIVEKVNFECSQYIEAEREKWRESRTQLGGQVGECSDNPGPELDTHMGDNKALLMHAFNFFYPLLLSKTKRMKESLETTLPSIYSNMEEMFVGQ